MCTAISATAGAHYFGRNLDYERTFGEKITITPRHYGFTFRNGQAMTSHYAIIGMALPYHEYPLYFDAVNEAGLGMAGLYFPENADYRPQTADKAGVASFELIPCILTQCKTVADAERLLEQLFITDEAFAEHMPPTPLHWMVADKEKAITVEQTRAGLAVYENPVGVLTNNPVFPIQLFNLKNFLSLSPQDPENSFSAAISLKPYSRGMGGLGLPGDLSSMSRFVKACFTKLNSVYGETEEEIVHQFFHILYSVYQQKGCVRVGEEFEMTNYTSCCNADKGIYYYTTYHNSGICAVDMHKEDLSGNQLITYDIDKSTGIFLQN